MFATQAVGSEGTAGDLAPSPHRAWHPKSHSSLVLKQLQEQSGLLVASSELSHFPGAVL